MNRTTFLVLAIAVVLGGIIIFLQGGKSVEAPTSDTGAASDSDIVYYYGNGCSHCGDVADFIEENDIESKVSFQKKEVWSNPPNSAEMMARAEECGLNRNNVGVPFLYAAGKCFMGTPDVTGFLSEEAGL